MGKARRFPYTGGLYLYVLFRCAPSSTLDFNTEKPSFVLPLIRRGCGAVWQGWGLSPGAYLPRDSPV